MNWTKTLGAMLAVFAMLGADFRLLRRNPKAGWAYAVITVFGLALSVTLIWNPDLPGPSEWISAVYGPLGRWLKP
jgi:hypothetical protein